MRSRILVLSSVILGSALGCGDSGMHRAGDGSADGGILDGRALTKEAGPLSEVGRGADVVGGSLGLDADLGAVDGGNTLSDGALPLPDADIEDGRLVLPDGAVIPRLDSSLKADTPMADAGLRLADGGALADGALDKPVDAALPAPDLGIASPPDLAADAANDAAPDLPPLSLLCPAPDCWAALMQDCRPAGTCSVQSAAGFENLCFADSVKVLTTIDEAAGKMITTVMKGSQICYQLDWDLAGGAVSGATSTGVLKNRDGTPVATIGDDGSGYSTITCTGAQPVVLSEGCDFVGPAMCEAGACSH